MARVGTIIGTRNGGDFLFRNLFPNDRCRQFLYTCHFLGGRTSIFHFQKCDYEYIREEPCTLVIISRMECSDEKRRTYNSLFIKELIT